MKALSLLVSLTAFLISGYYFVSDFTYPLDSNQIIYMSLLLVLMLICVIGILINIPLILSERRKMKVLLYNKMTHKSIKTKKFQFGLETS